MCEVGNGNTGAFENRARFRSGQAEGGESSADVGDLHIVGDDEVIKQLQYFVSLPAFRIHQQRVAALEGVEVRLNAALRVQHKSIDAVAGGKIANVVGDHAVQPADAVAAGHRDLGAPTQVIEAASREQGLELGARIAEVGRVGHAGVLTCIRPGKCCRSHRVKP